MFKLTVDNTVTVPVKGTMPDAKGVQIPFSFTLLAERTNADELNRGEGDSVTVAELLKAKVTAWKDVIDDDGAQVPFSPEALTSLLNILGMASVCYVAYLQACGAKGKEKN